MLGTTSLERINEGVKIVSSLSEGKLETHFGTYPQGIIWTEAELELLRLTVPSYASRITGEPVPKAQRGALIREESNKLTSLFGFSDRRILEGTIDADLVSNQYDVLRGIQSALELELTQKPEKIKKKNIQEATISLKQATYDTLAKFPDLSERSVTFLPGSFSKSIMEFAMEHVGNLKAVIEYQPDFLRKLPAHYQLFIFDELDSVTLELIWGAAKRLNGEFNPLFVPASLLSRYSGIDPRMRRIAQTGRMVFGDEEIQLPSPSMNEYIAGMYSRMGYQLRKLRKGMRRLGDLDGGQANQILTAELELLRGMLQFELGSPVTMEELFDYYQIQIINLKGASQDQVSREIIDANYRVSARVQEHMDKVAISASPQ
jgi:hypothetical protein